MREASDMTMEGQTTNTDAEEYVTAITVEYDGNSFSEQEIANLQSHLSEVATTRIRRHQGPAAGGPAISTVLEFVGMNAAAGLIGGAAWAVLTLFIRKLREKFSKKHHMPAYDSITIKFDDLDITIGLIGQEGTARLPEIIADIRDSLGKPPLSRGSVNRITLPVEYSGGEWRITTVNWTGAIPKYPFPYWEVQSFDASGVWGILDTEKGVLLNSYQAPDDQLLEHLIGQPTEEPPMYDPVSEPGSMQSIIHKLRPHLGSTEIGMRSARIANLAYGLEFDLYRYGPMRDEDVEALLLVCEWADELLLEPDKDMATELSKFVRSYK